MADKTGLPRFEGRQVAASRITIPGIGGGLNDALDVEPIALKHGQEGLAIIAWRVRDVDHVPLKKGEPAILARHHVLEATQVTLVGDEQVGDVAAILAANVERVKRAKDSMSGQGSLEDEVPDDQLTADELRIRRELQGKPAK